MKMNLNCIGLITGKPENQKVSVKINESQGIRSNFSEKSGNSRCYINWEEALKSKGKSGDWINEFWRSPACIIILYVTPFVQCTLHIVDCWSNFSTDEILHQIFTESQALLI
jgi:hypothetical protein